MKPAFFAIRLLAWALLAVLTMEVCARTEDKIRYGADLFGSYNMNSLYAYDALGKYGKPNASYLKWHLNEVGYRGPALRQGTYRIATIGSSETFGLYESATREWPRQLEQILNRDAGRPAYEVVDVAYPGLSIGTSLRRLPQMLGAVQPRMVVIYPSYTSYIETSEPQPWPEPAPGPAPPPRERQFEWRMAERLDTFSKAVIPTRLQDAMRAWQMRRAAGGAPPMEQLPERNIAAFETDLTRLTTELRSRGIEVVLVTHANRFGKTVASEDAPFLVAWRRFSPSLSETGLLDMEARMSDAVRQVGAREQVPVVDGARLIAPGHENFAEFVHFTDKGAKALATIVSHEIEREASVGEIDPSLSRLDAPR